MTARCLQADATSPAAWARALGVARGDALITDPPYCLLTRRRKLGDEREKKGRKIDSGPVRRFDDVRAYRDFTSRWLTLAVAHLTEQAPLVIWTNLLGREPITQVAKSLGYGVVRGEFTWGKRTREGNSGEELLRVVETALVFTRAPAPAALDGDLAMPWAVVAGYDDDGEATRWGNHPNHKPFGVVEPLLRTWSKAGHHVIDCFAGSGSIPAAAAKLGRHVTALELEPEWAARVNDRLAIGSGA
jgi:site-specific DNA-methyltransferase (adenine-specific)